MKIAMIGLRTITSDTGGIEKAVREISTRLVRQGHQVTCFCRPRYNTAERFEGVELRNVSTMNGKHGETFFYSLGALLKASREEFDIIHIHALAPACFSWIPRCLGKKVVVTIHGLDWQRAKWGRLARCLLKFGEWCATRCADQLICVSRSLKMYYRMRYPELNIDFIPNGCDAPDDKHYDVPDGLNSGEYILYLGRIVPEKGAHRLIAAFRRLKCRQQLIIAGPFDENNDYHRKLAKLAGNDKRIHFCGEVHGHRKESLLQHAAIFALPSEIEGLPIALIEAASRGICPVVSSIPTSVEAIGGEEMPLAYTFNPFSTDELKTALETALAVPELSAGLGRKAAEFVARNYNWNRISKATEKVYYKIAEKAS